MSKPEQIYTAYLESHQVSTDTRNLPAGCLFFALKGPNFNANEFAEQALTDGASYAIIDDPEVYAKSDSKNRLYLVEDALQALQDLARQYRKDIEVPVIAIGGSNGKTTTKEILLRVLSKRYKTQATKGNLNNHIGVPLSILSIQPDTELVILELGTNQPGDIAELVDIATPDCGIITNIGKEHLEGFGDLEGVAKEESVLFQYLLENDKHAFVNADDPWLNNMAKRLTRTTSYGWNTPADIQAVLIDSYPYLECKIDGHHVESQLPGAFNLSNILAAYTIGKHFEVPDELMVEAIAEYQPTNKRSQWMEHGGYRFLLDCYNANPSSMEVALRSLASDAEESVVILGDMLELGAFEADEHQAIVELALELGFHDVLLVGPAFGATQTNFRKFTTPEEAQIYLKENAPKPGSLLFLKGSRGIGVERSIVHLTNLETQ